MEVSPKLIPGRNTLPSYPRKRQLQDLIQIATLFEKEGLLSHLDSSHEEFVTKRAQELSVIAAISVKCARSILTIKGLRDNEGAWKFLRESSELHIFADSNFFAAAADPQQKEDNLFSLTFLQRFVVDKNSTIQQKMLQKEKTLDSIALKFTAPARDICVEMFLKSAAVIATLCSFFPEEQRFDDLKTLDILDRYLSQSWKSPNRQSQYHRLASHQHAASGWHIVNVTFMIQVQELQLWRERNMNTEDTVDQVVVSAEDITENAHVFCHKVLVEFFAWIFRWRNANKEETANGFQKTISEIIQEMNVKLANEMGCAKIEPVSLDLIATTFSAIERNAPTMADIDYDDIKMVPSRRICSNHDIEWVVKEVLMRGRWDGTPALSMYSTHIKVETLRQHQRASAQRERQASIPRSQISSQDGQQLGSHTPPAATKGIKRPASNSPNHELLLKRKRIDRESLSSAGPSESAADKRRSRTRGKNGTLYANDGEDSGDERGYRMDRNHHDLLVKGDGAVEIEEEETSNAIERLYETVLIWPIFPAFNPRKQARGTGPNVCLEQSTSGNRIRSRFPPRTPAQGKGFPFRNLRDGKRPNHSQQHSKWAKNLTLREKIALHLLTSMEPWADAHCERNRENILPDVTNATDIDQYRRHWKAIIPFEIRAMVTESVQSLLPKCKADPTLQFSEDLDASDFVSCVIDNVTPTSKLLNITCKTTSAVLRKRIAKEFQGGTLCVGYIKGDDEGRPTFTDLSLFACRRVSWDEDDVLQMGESETVDEMEMHLVASRNRFRDIGIWPGSTMYLLQLCHFAPSLRMYKAIEESYALPRFIQDVLFGRNCPSHLTDGKVLEELIDPGCAAYLKSLRKSSAQVDDYQLESLRSVVANVGNGSPLASSFSMIHGPPGTGKTTTILYLIGALMNHSQIGHIGHDQIHVLKNKVPVDDIVRCRKKTGGVRILVCAPSNKAVDNILDRIHTQGIPDGRGGVMRPQTVRISRAGYDHGELCMYSLKNKALPFDEHLHNVGQGRKNPSYKAQKSFFQECILVLSTLISSGGARIKNSKIPFDVAIIDEIGQAPEPEAIIPVVACSKVSHHCHVMAVGDHRQLPPVSLASFPMKTMKKRLNFDYDKQVVSIFERLYDNGRTSYRMLKRQYRMCGAVAEMNNHIFYEGRIESPVPESMFDTAYNEGWNPDTKCFAKQTFIDTSLLPDRREFQEKHDGDYRNMEEVNVIDEVLFTIKRLAGTSFHSLRNEIAVLVPYRSQVNHVRTVLERLGKYVSQGVSRQGFDIMVDSVDSMQGSEKDIIIFGCTRSNLEQRVGFLHQPNRLNVATSRARKLQIIIGDLSTLDASKYFSEMKRFCMQRRKNAALLRIHPTRSSFLLDGLQQYES